MLEDLDRFARVLCRLLGNGIRELFLNAAASSGVADFGFFGRGFWIDQPIAFNASQPRCGATEVRLSSPAIQAATLRLDHSPPSGGGSSRRRRNFISHVRRWAHATALLAARAAAGKATSCISKELGNFKSRSSKNAAIKPSLRRRKNPARRPMRRSARQA